MNGQTPASAVESYFEIDGLTIKGFDGCNHFGGRLDQPNRLRMSQRACALDQPILPLELSDPWPQLSRAKVVGDRLIVPLTGAGGGEALFRRRQD